MSENRLDWNTSIQITTLRPVCVFFMMSVHVNPGFRADEHDGLMWLIGLFEVDILGRTSVAALSLVSGFLLATAAGRPLLVQARERAATLYAPMAFWNAVFLALSFLALAVIGHRTSLMQAISGEGPGELIFKRVLLLYGAPASLALGFLRDLTIASIVVAILLRAPRVDILWWAPVAFVATVFDALEPVVFRPSILLFMILGAGIWRRRGHLAVPRPLRYVALVGFAILCIDALTPGVGYETLGGPEREVANVLRRAVLTVLALDLCLAAASTRAGRWCASISGAVYLAYLSHTTVLSILWFGWRRAFGNHSEPSYVIFFVGAPLAALALAAAAQPIIDRLPRLLQILLRGKARAANGARAWLARPRRLEDEPSSQGRAP